MPVPTEAHKVATKKRVLNELDAKIRNEEKLDKVVEARKASHADPNAEMTFLCECDDKACAETITMSVEEYKNLHRKTLYFVVVPSHVQLDLEAIITSFNSYVLVEKLLPQSGSNQKELTIEGAGE